MQLIVEPFNSSHRCVGVAVYVFEHDHIVHRNFMAIFVVLKKYDIGVGKELYVSCVCPVISCVILIKLCNLGVFLKHTHTHILSISFYVGALTCVGLAADLVII